MDPSIPKRRINIPDFTDTCRLEELLENLRRITRVPTCIVALDGMQVATTRGRSFCTGSCRLCQGVSVLSCSDNEQIEGLKRGESVMVNCPGGFSMIVAPVRIEGRAVAFFFSGPFSYSEEGRGSSPATVPVICREKVSRLLSLASTFTAMLSMCITHSFHLIREMEERKRAETRLHHSKDLYQTIFEHSGTAMAIVTDDGAIVRANIEFGDLIGIDQDVLSGIPWTLFVSCRERERIVEIHEKRVLDPLFSMNGYEVTLSRVDGRQVSAVLHAGGIPGSDRYVLSLLDVTERRRLEEMQEEAFAQIERNFAQLAVLNDRIRNPLTAIVGLAGMTESSLSRAVIRHAREIDDIVTHLDKRWLESEAVLDFLRKHYGAEGERPGSSLSESKNEFIP